VGFIRHDIPVNDFHAPAVAQLKTFVDLVDAQIVESNIVVRCHGGSGRTGTSAAAYWLAQGLTAADAMARVRSARPHAVETADQEAAGQSCAASGPG
jgi:protein-tyrosine phosphatase